MGIFDSLFGKPPAEQKKMIRNQINSNLEIMITNTTTNIQETINQSITDITNNMITNNTSKVEANVSSKNEFSGGDLNLGGSNNTVNFDQSALVKATVTAAQNIKNDEKQMNELINSIQASLKNSSKNDNKLKNDIEQGSKLNTLKSNEESMNKLVDNILNTISNNKPNTSEEFETTINNSIKTSINNITINENKTTSIVENHFTNNIQMNNDQACKLNMEADNIIKIGNINTSGENNKFDIKQVQKLTGLSSCIQQMVNVKELVNKVQQQSGVVTDNVSDNSNSNDNTVKQKTDQENKDITKDNLLKDTTGLIKAINPLSFLSGASNMFKYIIGICILCCVVSFIFNKFKKNDNNSEDTNNDNNEINEDTNNEEGAVDEEENNNQTGGRLYYNINNYIFNTIKHIDFDILILFFIIYIIIKILR